ncbi:hypothetical protein ZWY2020_029614 [Hordeum vulgare]|nr:hypothetical protein ZWY2020_029614 [Hordeum vulgare]
MMSSFRNARPLLSRMQRLMPGSGSSFLPCIKPAAVRRLSTSATGLVPRWYHEPRKAAAATAVTLSAAAMAFRSRYESEMVPCTNRSHLVVLSPEEERQLGESAFEEWMVEYKYKDVVVDPRHPDSVRVNLIAQRVLRAAHRGLGVDGCRDAAMLRVTEKRRKWRKASQPHTRHLRGLNLEIILAKDDRPDVCSSPCGKFVVTTGFLDQFNTDDEIAAAIAHELGHIIARHPADITSSDWLPAFLWRFFLRRQEIEADHIGILLLGAAGYHPHWARVILEKEAKFPQGSVLERKIWSVHPKPEKRLEFLAQAHIMEKALELYREASARKIVTGRYFR